MAAPWLNGSGHFLFWLQKLISDPRQRSVPIGHSDQAQNTLLGTQNIRESILDFTAHFGEINTDLLYLCRRGQSRPQREVFAVFPSVRRESIKKTLNLRFFAKKQVNFWVVYLLRCKLLIINENMMMHRQVKKSGIVVVKNRAHATLIMI